MKIRNGFVSNSSSSSFIIACKGNLKDVMKEYRLDNTSPWASIVNNSINILIENSRKIGSTEKEVIDYLDDEGYDEEDFESLKEYARDGYTIYMGLVSDESGLEAGLCDMSFNYKSDNLIIEKEEGY